MKLLYLLIWATLCSATLAAQRSYSITRTDSFPEMDGFIEREYWEKIPLTEGFTTVLPKPGRTPQQPTTVQMSYDQRGIYIAALCKSDHIRDDGSLRDAIGTGDCFSVELDTWNDNQNAFVFTTNAAGQRIDQRTSSTQSEYGFDTPWSVHTKQFAEGWTVEIFIPFTSLRFPAQQMQNWGIQWTRFDRTTGETSTWNPRDPLVTDVVLQYGQLEGLVDIHQKRRLGLSVGSDFAYSKYTEQPNDFSTSNKKTRTTIDGRIGINSATTLEVSLMPDSRAYLDFGENKNNFSGTYGSSELFRSVPRQLEQEESGVYDKSGFRSGVLINTYDIYSLITLTPRISITSIDPLVPIYQSKLTSRTKRNIGINFRTEVFNRPQYNYYNFGVPVIDYFEEQSQKYTTHPTINTVSIEKCFRNNSWVQAASSVAYLGTGTYRHQSALAGQWRDRSNRLEIKGNAQVFSKDSTLGKNVYLSVSTINRRWNYGLSYSKQSIGLPSSSWIDPNRIFYANVGTQLSAFMIQRNFLPRQKHWLNTTQGFSLSGYQYAGESSLYLQYRWSALTRHFQTLSARLFSSPMAQTESLTFLDGFALESKLLVPFSTSISWVSDHRKRWIWSADYNFSGNLGGDKYSNMFSTDLSWVISKSIRVRMAAGVGYFNNSRRIANPIVVSNTIEVYDWVLSQHNISALWTLSRALAVEFAVGQSYRVKELNQQYFTFQNDGSLIETPFNFILSNNNSRSPNYSASLYWNMTAVSQLRCSYVRSNRHYYSELFSGLVPPYFTSGIQSFTNFNLSLVWNFNQR